jgi:hypothetical protein
VPSGWHWRLQVPQPVVLKVAGQGSGLAKLPGVHAPTGEPLQIVTPLLVTSHSQPLLGSWSPSTNPDSHALKLQAKRRASVCSVQTDLACGNRPAAPQSSEQLLQVAARPRTQASCRHELQRLSAPQTIQPCSHVVMRESHGKSAPTAGQLLPAAVAGQSAAFPQSGSRTRAQILS